MNLPNLLELALTHLPPVYFKHRYYTGETRNAIGVLVPSYSDWVVCRGMVQPVARSRYADLGLDFAKNYVNIWGSINLRTVALQEQPDQIHYNGKIWTITTVTEWNPYNWWGNFTAVHDKRLDAEAALVPPVPPM